MQNKIGIEIYELENGKSPYLQWESKIPASIQAIVDARLTRIQMGNFGDCKSIRGAKGMYELRIHVSPGYRIYFGKEGNTIILLLLGGLKEIRKKIFRNPMNIGKIILCLKGGNYEQN